MGVTEAVEVAEVALGACMEFRETPACREEGEQDPVSRTKAERSEWVEDQENEVLEARRGESSQESKQIFY